MNINRLQGTTAYTNISNATPPVDNTLPQDQAIEDDETKLHSKNSDTTQKAFEVTLTREARKKSAAETTEATATENQTATQPLENQTGQNMEQAHKNSRIVNIVA